MPEVNPKDLFLSKYEALGPFRPPGPPEEEPSNFWRALAAAGAVMGAYALHRVALSSRGYGYGEKLYHIFRNVERKSPGGVLGTFRVGELFSSYALESASYSYEQIFKGRGLTPLGRHLQRLLGDKVDLVRHFQTSDVLKFVRDRRKVSPFLKVAGYEGVSVRFAQKGSLTKTSALYKSGKSEVTASQRSKLPSFWKRVVANVKFRKEEQLLKDLDKAYAVTIPIGGEEVDFYPILSKIDDAPFKSAVDIASRLAFDLLNRPMKLLAQFSVGLPYGAYDTNTKLLTTLMARRVFPAMAGIAAVGYLDYLTGHVARDTLASIPVRADILRAELTDKLPFGREVADFYEQTAPGPQYGPLALPAGGFMIGAAWHYARNVLLNDEFDEATRKAMFRGDLRGAWEDFRGFVKSGEPKALLRGWSKLGKPVKGALIGLALMQPFVPGMLGSRETADERRAVYSGEVLEPVRLGRWWELGATPWEGGRIVGYRPNWYAEMKSGAWYKATFGSEEAYWEHHPIISPIEYFDDPYWLERRNYNTRPYPITAPMFTDVPLFGPVLAATLGKTLKPPVYMHQGEFDEDQYTAFSQFVEPKGPDALAPLPPVEEFGVFDALSRETGIFANFIGLPGFVARTAYSGIFKDTGETDVYWESAREMTSVSRQYYERELGSIFGTSFEGPASMSEPLRRFIQRDPFRAHANEVPNQMPSWLPGEQDYPIDFHTGDPYVKVKFGHLRLPGPGYEALHPELEGVDPEEYPDIYKLEILADVAPSSSQYFRAKSAVERQLEEAEDTALRIRYERVLRRVEEVKESPVSIETRKFTGDVEQISGTVEEATQEGVRLSEYPGRLFRFSGVGMSAADLSARMLAENNEGLTRTEIYQKTSELLDQQDDFLQEILKPGTKVQAVISEGALQTTEPRAVIFSGSDNINRELVERGFAAENLEDAGPEYKAMHGMIARGWGSLAEEVAFSGDESVLNPLRYIPNPSQTKLWQARTALEQYQNREMYGSKMRRWDRPFDDYISPYIGGAVHRMTGQVMMSDVNAERRDMNTLTDMLGYLRAQIFAGMDHRHRGRYTIQALSTSIGTNQFYSVDFLEKTLPMEERPYLRAFLEETDPEVRAEILSNVSPELKRLLESQWAAQQAAIAQAEGQSVPQIEEGGRLIDQELYEEYRASGSRLNYGDWERSMEIAQFFARRGLKLPDERSPLWNPAVDYEDLKLKLIQHEGYDFHDFNLWNDRASTLWRKPYLDGAVRELTSGGGSSAAEIQRAIERILLKAKGSDGRASVTVMSRPALTDNTNISLDMFVNRSEEIRQDARRYAEEYR